MTRWLGLSYTNNNMRRTTLEPARGTRGTKNTKPQRGVFDGPAIRIDPHKIDADLKPIKSRNLKNLMAAETRTYQSFQNEFFTSRNGVLIANSPEDCRDGSNKQTLFSNNWKLRENTMAELFANPEIAKHGQEWLSLLTAFVSGESIEAKNLVWDSTHNIDSQPTNAKVHTNLEHLISSLARHNGNVNLAPIVKSFLSKKRELSNTEKFFILQKLMLQYLYTDETMNQVKVGANMKAFTKLVNQLATPLFTVNEVLADDPKAIQLFNGYFTYYSGRKFDLQSARNAIKFTPYETLGNDVTIAEALVNQAKAMDKKGEHANALRLFGYAYKLLNQRGLKQKNSELAAEIKEAAMKTALKASAKIRSFTKNIDVTQESESSNNPPAKIDFTNPLEQADELVNRELSAVEREIPKDFNLRQTYFEDKIARLHGWDGQGSVDDFYNSGHDYTCPQDRPPGTIGTILTPSGVRGITLEKVQKLLKAEEVIIEQHRNEHAILLQALKELSWVYHIDQFYMKGQMSEEIQEAMKDLALTILTPQD